MNANGIGPAIVEFLDAVVTAASKLRAELAGPPDPTPDPVPDPTPDPVPDPTPDPVPDPQPQPPPPDPIQLFSVTVVLDAGPTINFSQVDAKELGDYIDPSGRFIQRCIELTSDNNSIPLRVQFRPHRDNSRREFVFWYGRTWGQPQANDIGPYTVTIRDESGGSLFCPPIRVPSHTWFSRWRVFDRPIPHLRNPASILAVYGVAVDPDLAKLCKLPPLSKYSGPMDSAGVVKYFGTPGDRADLGYFTEWQAALIAKSIEPSNTDLIPLMETVLGQAEASWSITRQLLHDTTHAPVDFSVNSKAWTPLRPGVSPMKFPGEEFIPRTIPANAGDPAGGGWTPDTEHCPALEFMAAAMIDDPYLIEEAQYAANFGIALNINFRFKTPNLVPYCPDCRATAWSLRTLLHAAYLTPSNTPPWMLPRSYFERALQDFRGWFEANGPASDEPSAKALHLFSGMTPRPKAASTALQPWQDSYLISSLATAVRFGYPEWLPSLRWAVAGSIARAGGEPAWDKRYNVPYEQPIYKSDLSPINNWQDAMSAVAAWPANAYKVPGESDPKYPGRYPQYPASESASLALALAAGVEEARPAYEWARSVALAQVALNVPMQFRWAIKPA